MRRAGKKIKQGAAEVEHGVPGAARGGRPAATGGGSRQGWVRQQQSSSLFVLSQGDAQISVSLLGGSCPLASSRFFFPRPKRGRCRRALRHDPLPALSALGAKLRHRERAGCDSRLPTQALFPCLQQNWGDRNHYGCYKKRKQEKKKKKKIHTSLRAEKSMSLGAIPHPLHPQEGASNIYTFLTCEPFNQGKAIPERAFL